MFTFFGSLWQHFATWLGNLLNGLIGPIMQALNSTVSLIANGFNKLMTFLGNLVGMLAGFIGGIVYLLEKVVQLLGLLVETIGLLLEMLLSVLEGIVHTFASLAAAPIPSESAGPFANAFGYVLPLLDKAGFQTVGYVAAALIWITTGTAIMRLFRRG